MFMYKSSIHKKKTNFNEILILSDHFELEKKTENFQAIENILNIDPSPYPLNSLNIQIEVLIIIIKQRVLTIKVEFLFLIEFT